MCKNAVQQPPTKLYIECFMSQAFVASNLRSLEASKSLITGRPFPSKLQLWFLTPHTFLNPSHPCLSYPNLPTLCSESLICFHYVWQIRRRTECISPVLNQRKNFILHNLRRIILKDGKYKSTIFCLIVFNSLII